MIKAATSAAQAISVNFVPRLGTYTNHNNNLTNGAYIAVDGLKNSFQAVVFGLHFHTLSSIINDGRGDDTALLNLAQELQKQTQQK